MAELTLTDQNFSQEIEQAKMPAVVDFWAPWCAPCRIVGPTIEALSEEYEGKVKVGKMNVDENQTPARFGIMSIPTVLIFKNGKPIKTMIGAQGRESYKKAIDEALAS